MEMTRKQLYERIKELGVEKEIKETFDKNYTNVSTALLQDFIVTEELAIEEAMMQEKTKDTKIYAMLQKLVDILKKKYILLDSEVKAILNK